ncbi:MAG: DUF1491 family protein [Alphaproteobacteria bacterium]|nr:DUF1491 family protein [Alphaproteobacteria bacterium]
MRINSELWVKAFVRNCNGSGAAAFIVRRGDEHGGSVFVRINRLDGTSILYGPAAAGIADAVSDRFWSLKTSGDDNVIDELIARERSFDPDLWVVEVEDREGRHFLGDWLISE